jgi:predicted GTPase
MTILDHLFGREHGARASPAALLVEAEAEIRALLRDIRSDCEVPASVGAEMAVTRQADLEEITAGLNAATEHLPRPDDPFRVVLVGRTQAGKSTLFSHLTATEDSEIGHGAQRCTRTVIATPMYGHERILVVDTPGVGALDGDEDRALALATARTADLVVWVAANNSTPLDTASALKQIARWGVPMFIALNCRADISDPEARRQFIAYPEDTFTQLDGHLARLLQYLEPSAQRPIGVHPIHASAALLGARTDAPDPDLLRESHVESLTSAIVREVAVRGPQRRAAAIADTARRALVEAVDRATELATDLDVEIDSRREAGHDLNRRAERLISDVGQEVEVSVADLLRSTDDWADRHYRRSDTELQRLWDQEERRIRDAGDALFRDRVEYLRRRLDRIDEDVATEWSKQFAARRAKRTGPSFGKVLPAWVEAAGRKGLIIGAGAAGTAIGFAMGGPGGAAIGGSIASVLAEQIATRVRVRRVQLVNRRKDLHGSVTELRSAILDDLSSEWNAVSGRIRDELARHRATQDANLASTEDLARHARQIAAQAAAGVTRADVVLVHTWARTEGRHRVALAIRDVVRHPGFACWIPLEDSTALDELLLWNLKGRAEEVRPLPAGPTMVDAKRAAYALDLGRRGGVLVPAVYGYLAYLPDAGSEAFRAAEAKHVARASGVTVQLRPLPHRPPENVA